jgi:hypothetical protein
VLAGAAGVVAGEAAAVACFLDRFFGVSLAAGVALVTAAASLGLGLALCDRFFGLADAVGLGDAFWEYASGEAAIANRARSERNVRIKYVFYLDLMPVGNPGSVKKMLFRPCNRLHPAANLCESTITCSPSGDENARDTLAIS